MKLIRYFLLLTTAGFCLLVGFWIGNHPSYYQKYLDLYKPEIIFYAKEMDELFPLEFRNELQAKSPVKIHFEPNNTENVDVFLVDQVFLKSFDTAIIGTSKNTTTHWNDIFKLISPDFQRELFKRTKAIPVLWKIKDNHLVVLSFVIDANKNHKASILWKFIQIFLNNDIHKQWLNRHKWNTTLLHFDEGSLDENRKASAIRKSVLVNLEI